MVAVARSASRRSFIKLAAAAPLLTQIAARNLYAQAATAMGKDPRQNVYTRLGVRTVINCRGTWTYLSGSLEFPEVREAQAEAAQHFVNMLELQQRGGAATGGVDWCGIRDCHFRRGRCHGSRNRCLYGRY